MREHEPDMFPDEGSGHCEQQLAGGGGEQHGQGGAEYTCGGQ